MFNTKTMLMKMMSIIVFLFYTAFVSAQEPKPDFRMKYEYKVEVKSYSRSLATNAQCFLIGGKPANLGPVVTQFNAYLNAEGAAGWELSSQPAHTYVQDPGKRQAYGGGEISCPSESLTTTVILRRVVYDGSNELEKQVAFYSKRYADSVAMALQDRVNNLTWSQLGENYKKEIVADMLKQLKVLLEANEQKIISALKK